MGCWNGTCGVSNLPIKCGDPIRAVLITGADTEMRVQDAARMNALLEALRSATPTGPGGADGGPDWMRTVEIRFEARAGEELPIVRIEMAPGGGASRLTFADTRDQHVLAYRDGRDVGPVLQELMQARVTKPRSRPSASD